MCVCSETGKNREELAGGGDPAGPGQRKGCDQSATSLPTAPTVSLEWVAGSSLQAQEEDFVSGRAASEGQCLQPPKV